MTDTIRCISYPVTMSRQAFEQDLLDSWYIATYLADDLEWELRQQLRTVGVDLPAAARAWPEVRSTLAAIHTLRTHRPEPTAGSSSARSGA